MDPAARNNALDKLTWRALWWFRWAAAATVAFGILIVGVESPDVYDGDYWFKSTAGVTLLLGIIMGVGDARERVDGHLAEPADRHRQRPQRASRR